MQEEALGVSRRAGRPGRGQGRPAALRAAASIPVLPVTPATSGVRGLGFPSSAGKRLPFIKRHVISLGRREDPQSPCPWLH